MISSGTKVRTAPCKSCPFAGENPVALSGDRLASILSEVVGNKVYHSCYSDSSNRTICNGSMTIAVRTWHLWGLIPEPTLKAWYQTLSKKGKWNHNILPPGEET